MTKILLAGATGYLGGYIFNEIGRSNLECRAVVRNKIKFKDLSGFNPEII